MRIYEVQERTTPLLEKLLDIWEQSVRVTHTFLSEEGLKRLKTYVPAAICDVEHLLIAESASGEPVGFMGTAGKRLVMFFFLPEEHGKDSGRQLLQYGMQHYGIEEDIVNEHDPKIAGFYAFNSPIPLDTDTFL